MLTSDPSTAEPNEIANLDLFLLNLRYKEGRLIEAEGNQPILLDDPESAWVIYAGTIDLFAIPCPDEENLGAPEHLLRSKAGQIFLGIAPETQGSIRLLMRGTTGTRLIRLKKARLWELGQQLEYSEIVGAMCAEWVLGLAGALGRELPPKESRQLDAGQSYQGAAGQALLPTRGLIWARLQGGAANLLGEPALAWSDPATFLPLSKQLWAELAEPADLTTLTTIDLLREPAAPHSFEQFHQLICTALQLRQVQAATTERSRWQQRVELEQALMQQALERLAAPLSHNGHQASIERATDSHDALYAAGRKVCQELGLELGDLAKGKPEPTPQHALKVFARSARIHVRNVALRGQWWRRDSGPLLAFHAATNSPVALLQRGGGYRCWDPVEGTTTPVTAQSAAALSPYAYMFYRPFPDQLLTTWNVLKFGIASSRRDIFTLLGIGALIGLLGLVPPLATGLIFNTIIPAAELSALVQVGIGLLLLAIVTGGLYIARGLTVLRLQSRVDARLQAAVWDRLLSLPPPFFRTFTAGGLGMRAMGISQISQLLSGHVCNAILNSLFSIFSLGLLFYYSVQLALIAVGLVILSLIVTITIVFLYIRHDREQLEFQGQVSGRVLQLLKGVVKLRIAGAENQAFAQWAEPFTAQRSLAYRGRKITNILTAYNAAYPVVALLIIFSLLAISSQLIGSVGDLVAFNLAFSQFLGSWSVLGATLMYVLPIIPTFERLRPILQAQPEITKAKSHPGELTGKVELAHISFRYGEKSPQVLHDVSLEIQPGEFVALVGASGSGKSTLLRLLLGFDTPETGAIYYDDQDLADLDLREVRLQIGVVLQNATLFSGALYSNIIGSALNLTIDDAWEAARMAGFDEDIKSMPMGMHTVVSEAGSNLSGGQRQRLFIARALVTKPRMLLFDEATSALDNRTQEIVSRSIESLHATRIVIAHRLSTIMKADRIYVFDKGRIVQVGTYQSLSSQPGPFADLAKRQKL